MRNIAAGLLITVAAVTMTVSLSCSDRATHGYRNGIHYADSLEYYRSQWKRFNNTGSFDSLITVTKPFYSRSVQAGDSVSALYAGVFIAQAYLFEENADSVQKYIESVSRLWTWDTCIICPKSWTAQ